MVVCRLRWPFINYVLSILKAAYREFEERVGRTGAPRGSKRELVLASIERLLRCPARDSPSARWNNPALA